MKFIELTETQFKNYSKMHSSRNYFQTVEFSKMKEKNSKVLYLGYINEQTNTLMAATMIFEKIVCGFKVGYVPGGFLVDYDNEELFKDFSINLKLYLKPLKYAYVRVDNRAIYKMFDKNGQVLYFDTNILKYMDELDYRKIGKVAKKEVILKTEDTPNETFKKFNLNTKRNIKILSQKAITIYKENNNFEPLLNFINSNDVDKVKDIIKSFNTENNTAEIYFAKINPEQYINNYRFLLKEEDVRNDKLNSIMQNVNIKKSISLINKKMNSDKLITKYNNEIIKATNLYSNYPTGAIIGAILTIKNNREIYFLYEGYNKNLSKHYSSHLIKWEIIKKYLNEGYHIFNFGSIKNMNKNNGNYLFKMGFGCNVYEYVGECDLVVNKLIYIFIKLINDKIK